MQARARVTHADHTAVRARGTGSAPLLAERERRVSARPVLRPRDRAGSDRTPGHAADRVSVPARSGGPACGRRVLESPGASGPAGGDAASGISTLDRAGLAIEVLEAGDLPVARSPPGSVDDGGRAGRLESRVRASLEHVHKLATLAGRAHATRVRRCQLECQSPGMNREMFLVRVEIHKVSTKCRLYVHAAMSQGVFSSVGPLDT
jgi:hypothetical protein